MSILVCIPHLSGREQYLANAIRGYAERTSVDWHVSIVRDAPSAGVGWNRCVEHGLRGWPDVEYVLFSNDDVVPAPSWWCDLVDAVDAGWVPCMRIEPAGGHVGEHFEEFPPMPPDRWPVPRDPAAYFFAAPADEQPSEFGERIPMGHPNLPFCSVAQWTKIGPFPPVHIGSDRWFAARARLYGMDVVAAPGAVHFNYNANIGRHRGEWTEMTSSAFDGVFAMPAYLNGVLRVDQTHPLRETPEGARLANTWRAWHERQEEPSDPRVKSEDGRIEIMKETMKSIRT